MLSAEDIIYFHQNAVKPINTQSKKKLVPENTVEEQLQIQKCLESFKNILQFERVERRNMRSEAEWLMVECVAKVTRRVGNIFPQYGYEKDGLIYLLPEEALFLLEMNRLDLLWNGVPFSIESAYTVLLGKNSKCSFIQYRAFKIIATQGFRVQQVQKRSHLDVTENAKKLKLDTDVEILSTSTSNANISSSNIESESTSEIDYSEVFRNLREDGPSTSNYSIDYSPTYYMYPPNVSIKSKSPDYQLVTNSGNEQLSLFTANPDKVATLTSLSGLNSVAFYQMEKVDLDTPH